MAKLLVLYNQPSDASRFDDYYTNTHIPIARTIPGLQKCEISSGVVATPEGASGYHLVATLTFASVADLQAGMASPEGRKAAADIANFADGGAEILIVDDHAV